MTMFAVLTLGADWRVAAVLVLYVIGLRLTVASSDDLGKAIAQAVSDALQSAHISPKVVAGCWGCSVTRVYQVLSGDTGAPVTLAKLLALPFPFWLTFSGWLFARIAQQRMREMVISD
jgi:hypothetical protein